MCGKAAANCCSHHSKRKKTDTTQREENTQRQLNYIFIIIVTLNVYKWHLNTPCELRVNCVCVCVLLCAVDKCGSLTTMTTTAASFSA